MTRKATKPSLDADVQSVLKWLKRHSTTAALDGMVRYGVPSDKAFGVAMKDLKVVGKELGRNHELAAALWDTGVYEARMVCAFVDDPALITAAQMDRWCHDFDNWAIGDTLCFHLFDRTPFAWAKVAQWSSRRNEFQKRAAFALLWIALNAAAVTVARRLADSHEPSARWNGRTALKELTSPAVTRRLKA